jgi:hypothetical protein
MKADKRQPYSHPNFLPPSFYATKLGAARETVDLDVRRGPGGFRLFAFLLLPFAVRFSGFAFWLLSGLFFSSSVKSPDGPPPHPHSLRKAKE